MVRSRLALTLAGVLCAASVRAQQPSYTGLLTAHIGAARGGDVKDSGVTPGVSLAVIEGGGLGVEVDLAHTRRIDADRFVESGITSLMLNALGSWPRLVVRPFVVGGVGVLRVRAGVDDGDPLVSRTDWGFNVGGGVLYMFDDTVGIRGDARYFRYVQRHDDLPQLDNGVFDFWRVSVGATLSWPIR